MALFGQIAAGVGAGGGIGATLSMLNSLFQKQISITDEKGEDTVYINVAESENLKIDMNITEHPVADSGAAVDYVAGTSTPFVIQGIISNRNLDMRRDPLGALAGRAAAYAPGAFAAVKAGVSLASKFVDLGEDEITRKLRILNQWARNATLVRVLGAKIDYQKISGSNSTIYFLVNNIEASTGPQSGDGIEYNITLRQFVTVGGSEATGGQGSRLLKQIASTVLNPFR